MKKAPAFWIPLSLLLLADCSSKQLAEEHLEIQHVPHEVFGDLVRFTLAYNPGAAFSLYLGEHSRWIFTIIATIIIVVLLQMYRRTEPHDRFQAIALALIAGGALGNLVDRVRSPLGVVDFIDIGVGDLRFYTFNIADLGVTIGAAMLALLLLRRDREMHAAGASGLIGSGGSADPPSLS
ncbi:MAG TPA: signal peptidase II [Gemmatimonadaceae bacterium]|nr:signal peptidase II [Gemmatimonadaceae bacterium]